ncbi:MAG: ParA family protein [Gammaproteobacteria bacterium]
MKILATYNIKGGVGKTATAVNLAWVAAQDGYRVLLWDLDPQGAASYYLGMDNLDHGVLGHSVLEPLFHRRHRLSDVVRRTPHERIDLVPADFSYRNLDLELSDLKRPTKQFIRLMRPLSDAYDVLIIDSAPSVSLVSANIFNVVDALLVPIVPTPLAVRAYDHLKRHLKESQLRGRKVLAFYSMADRRKRLHRELMRKLPLRYPEIMLSVIPQAAVIERMGTEHAPLGHFAPDSPASLAYEALWDEVRRKA